MKNFIQSYIWGKKKKKFDNFIFLYMKNLLYFRQEIFFFQIGRVSTSTTGFHRRGIASRPPKTRPPVNRAVDCIGNTTLNNFGNKNHPSVFHDNTHPRLQNCPASLCHTNPEKKTLHCHQRTHQTRLFQTENDRTLYSGRTCIAILTSKTACIVTNLAVQDGSLL